MKNPCIQKAAIYIRVSTHWQVDRDSLQVQRRELIDYARAALNVSSYEIFEDAGYSAKNTDRPAYLEMMGRLRTGEFSHLLVWKIDRISRNLLDFTSMYKELQSLGVVFVSKNEQFDTSSAIGEAMLKIILVFAELERNMTAERVTAVMLSRAGNGQWNGGRVPYGYKRVGDGFEADPTESPVYAEIVELYLKHRALSAVSGELNRRGIPTRVGSQWSNVGVQKILRNVFYTGAYRYNVRRRGEVQDADEWITIENHHLALIEKTKFDYIQQLLSSNRRNVRIPGATHMVKHVHIFGGLVRCGLCGSNMIANADNRRLDGWQPSKYSCSMRRNKSSACPNKYVSDVYLGPFVFRLLSNILKASKIKRITPGKASAMLLSGDEFHDVVRLSPQSIEDFVSLCTNPPDMDTSRFSPVFKEPEDTESDTLKQRKQKIENALKRLQSLYLYGETAISEKDYVLQKAKLDDELKAVDAKLATIIKTSQDEKVRVTKTSYVLMMSQLSTGKIEFKRYMKAADQSVARDFLQALIDHIDVSCGKITQITFKSRLKIVFEYE